MHTPQQEKKKSLEHPTSSGPPFPTIPKSRPLTCPRPFSSSNLLAPKAPSLGRRLFTTADQCPIIHPDVDVNSLGGASLLQSSYRTFLQYFDGDLKSFASNAVANDLSLRKILQETCELPRPNSLRTAGCVMLLVKACRIFSCQKDTLRQLLDEVLSGIYQGYKDGMQDDTDKFMSLSTYADLLNTANARIHYLEEQLRAAKESASKHVTQLDRVMTTWKKMLVTRIFVVWRNYNRDNKVRLHVVETAVRSRYRRDMVRKAMMGWRFFRLQDIHEKSQEYSKKESNLFKVKLSVMQSDLTRLKEDAKDANARLERSDQVVSNTEKRNEDLRKRSEELTNRIKQLEHRSQQWKDLSRHALQDVWSCERQSFQQAISSSESISAGLWVPIREMGGGVPSAPKDDSLSLYTGDDVSKIPCEKACLLWVRYVLTKRGKTHKLPVNLSEDFRNGDIYFELASSIMEIEPSKVAKAKLDLHPVSRCAFFLKYLTRYVGYDIPIEAAALSEGATESIACSIGYLIRAYSQRICSMQKEDGKSLDEPGATREMYDKLMSIRREWLALGDRIVGHYTQTLIEGNNPRDNDEKVKLELMGYYEIELERLQDLFVRLEITELTTQMHWTQKVCDVVKKYAEDLRRVFKFYSPAGLMSEDAYYKLLTDCKLLSKPKVLPKKLAGVIFTAVNASTLQIEKIKLDNLSSTQRFSLPDVPVPSRSGQEELSPLEWVDALIHIAFILGDPQDDLIRRTEEIITANVLAYGASSSVDEFRAVLNTRAVQSVVATYNAPLTKIFRKYAAMAMAKASKGKGGEGKDNFSNFRLELFEMDQESFLQLVKDFRLHDAQLTVAVVKDVFNFMQDTDIADNGTGAEVGDGSEKMVYKEFVDALVAVSMYKVPHPWLPMAERLGQFIGKIFLPADPSKKKK